MASQIVGRNLGFRPEIKIDNKSAISLIKNPVHHDRSKHIDVRFHFVRECAQDGLM
jgi:hypothetical protein